MQEFRIFRAIGFGFRAWFRNFVPFTLLTFVLYTPVVVWLATRDLESMGSLDDALAWLFTWPIYAIGVLAALVPVALTYRVIRDLNGERVSMLTSIRHGVRGIVPALLLAVLVHVVQLIPIAGVIGGVILTCTYFVVGPAAVAERLGPFAAFRRSAELTRGRRGGIFLLNLIVGLLVFALLLAWIIPMVSAADADELGPLQAYALVFVLFFGFLQMYVGIVGAVSYALLRREKEGVSHEALARVFE